MFVSEPAMLVSGSCVLLGIFVLAERVVMLGLMMMMRRGVVVSVPDDDAHALDALVTVPYELPPLWKTFMSYSIPPEDLRVSEQHPSRLRASVE